MNKGMQSKTTVRTKYSKIKYFIMDLICGLHTDTHTHTHTHTHTLIIVCVTHTFSKVSKKIT
jgi:hypothetical protein